MSFSPAGGNISGADDVALNNPQDNEVLTYNSTLAKWQNEAGGTVDKATIDALGIDAATLQGSEPSDFAPASHSHILNDLPAGSMFTRTYTGGAWQTRGTSRTDIVCMWIKRNAADPNPAINATYMLNNVDILLVRQ